VRRVLVANRGEIAFRAIRVCRQLGLESVAVYSSADANSCHRWAADHAICIGPPPPKSSYLNAGALIEIAGALKCDAIYPGYGFLAENHAFAERSKQAGLTFIGPDSDCIARMGDKVAARQAAAAAGIPVVPGSDQGYTTAAPAKAASAAIGFPLLLKASGGGGGRGMRIVDHAEDFVAQFEQASAEALAAFGNAEVYLERFFPRVRSVGASVSMFRARAGNPVRRPRR
jgi:acetyl-CoA carboxylase biotin carboxylase subunit